MVSKLEQVTKEDMVRKSKGFLGLSKDKSEADVERIKATVMLCYGYVTFHSPPKYDFDTEAQNSIIFTFMQLDHITCRGQYFTKYQPPLR